jgi:Zn-dependent M28 family amino/carboxypeptidase
MSVQQHTIRSARMERLRADVHHLGGQIGERNLAHYAQLMASARFLEESLARAGHRVRRQEYEARGHGFANLEVELPGITHPDEIVVIGAHYDTAHGSPGANDNGSALAALLELARAFAASRPARTLRLVAFTNEERPFLHTRHMGSRVYARRCKDLGETIAGMVSLETIGYCSQAIGSQRLSLFGTLLPRRGNFLAFVGNRASRNLLTAAISAFGSASAIPARGLTLPTHFPGAWSSDHWSFWKEQYPALMITDTAPLRYPHYHKPTDTPDKLEYGFLTDVVTGLEAMVAGLAGIDAAALSTDSGWEQAVGQPQA